MNIESKRLFVGGLPYKYKEGQLLRLFVSEGKVIDARIVFNKWGKSRGMGYVEFENIEDAIRAKEKYHNFEVEEDRTIIVDFAKIDPMLTEEGQKNKREGEARRQLKWENRKTRKRKNETRQTVWDSRKHGAKVGKKFAKKTKKKL
ncbi:RNA-binding protein [Patescibacteria group bacterium]|nr:RNA-binding protein [Patescibacteria group bacterium]MCG2702309.1 RNA-binding protein [Candidatus Parcubacteria bacterium]MBU4264588.1 RNA-binding protein [Patescibacteria group bacterium]MBU4390256.1 RNA-binding protein [Patescibacteria group bacterium]MBU4397326.1 RNA-binding protein [Patescibacteria group bacterium]